LDAVHPDLAKERKPHRPTSVDDQRECVVTTLVHARLSQSSQIPKEIAEFKTLIGKEVEIDRLAMSQTESHSSAAVKDERSRNLLEILPNQALGG